MAPGWQVSGHVMMKENNEAGEDTGKKTLHNAFRITFQAVVFTGKVWRGEVGAEQYVSCSQLFLVQV